MADLFNPTFFMFLGILVLVVALIVVYFESKMRDQNHKIASMLSLVSTLAEDMNGVKMGLNHLAITRVGGSMPQNFQKPLEQSNTTFISKEDNNLIEVSDDDEDSDSEDSDSDEESKINDSGSELDLGSDSDSDESDENNTSNNIKILKLNINSDNINDIDESTNLEFDKIDDLEEFDDNLSDTHSEISGTSIKFEEHLNDITEDTGNEILNISSSDLKTINISLEESHSETIDYKKLALPKLRSIVSEKGLTTDASKLKKNELFKLLGVE